MANLITIQVYKDFAGMKGLTEEQPKCLLKLNGQPLIDIQTKALERAVATDIAIVT